MNKMTAEGEILNKTKVCGFSWTPLLLGMLLAFPSFSFVEKYAGLFGIAGYTVSVVGMLYLGQAILLRYQRHIEPFFPPIAAIAIAGLAVAFPLLHPIEDSRGPGKSSDRNEGLEMAVTRMADGKTPYYPKNKIAGPLSLLPGSILLSAPFVALGNSGFQNVFWLGAFLLACVAFFKNRALALFLFAIPLVLSLAVQYEFVSGGDLISNSIFVPIGFMLVLGAWHKDSGRGWLGWSSCIFLGICLASRANFLILLPLFGAMLWRLYGFKPALLGSVLTFFSFLAVVLPFYFNDPAGFSPLGSRNKVSMVDQVMPHASLCIMAATVASSVFCSLWLITRKGKPARETFFRCCTFVTLVPILGMILATTIARGSLDLGILKDRFGIMYVYFALIGWGGSLFKDNGDIFSSPNLKTDLSQA